MGELGIAPQNVIQRDQLAKALVEVDEDQSGFVDFMEFLQLMRLFLDHSDAEMLRKEKDAVTRTKFTPDEVAQWKAIFNKFDTDGNGEMDTMECKKLLSAV